MKKPLSLLCPWITECEKDSLKTVFCLQVTNVRLCKRTQGCKGRDFSFPLWSVLVLQFPECSPSPSLSAVFSVSCLVMKFFQPVLTPSQSCLARFGYHYLGSICLQWGRPGLDPWVGKIPWRRQWQHTPELLPGKSHGWRSLVGYNPWGRKESDMTERLQFHFHFHFHLGMQTIT